MVRVFWEGLFCHLFDLRVVNGFSAILIETFLLKHFRVNVCLGPTEGRLLASGLHAVCDIYCSSCQQILGWKYVSIKMIIFLFIPAISYSSKHFSSLCFISIVYLKHLELPLCPFQPLDSCLIKLLRLHFMKNQVSCYWKQCRRWVSSYA